MQLKNLENIFLHKFKFTNLMKIIILTDSKSV